MGYKRAHAGDACTDQVEDNSCLLFSRLGGGWGEWSKHKEVQTPGSSPAFQQSSLQPCSANLSNCPLPHSSYCYFSSPRSSPSLSLPFLKTHLLEMFPLS